MKPNPEIGIGTKGMKKIGLVLIIIFLFTGCTLHGAIRHDLYKEIENDNFSKLPLTAALVQTKDLKSKAFYFEAHSFNFNIELYPGIINLLQATLSSVFEKVFIVDSPTRSAGADIIVIPQYKIRQIPRGFLGPEVFESFLVLNIKNLANDKTLQYQQEQQIYFNFPAGAFVAAFITEFSLFTLSPITIPWMRHSLVSHAKDLIEKDIKTSVKLITDEMKADERLAQINAAFNKNMVKKEEKPSLEKTSALITKSDVDDFPTIKAKPNKNAYAIVIGIENYRQKLPKADFATHDAETVAQYLTKVMGYPEENVVTLLNDHASNVDLAKYFENWLPNNAEKDSTVFIYYSGHGAPNTKTGDAFLVPYDGDPAFIDQTGYSLKRLYDSLGKLQAKEIIVALDSCFSGAGGRSVIAKGSRPLVMTMDNLIIPSKVVVLSASSGEQTSSTYEEKGHGLFTYFLLKGIKGADDTNKNGTLEVRELFDYIKPQVELIARKVYNNEQTPQMTAPKENQKIFLRK